MSTEVGAIHVVLGARTQDFEAGLARAKRKLEEFEKKMQSMVQASDAISRVSRRSVLAISAIAGVSVRASVQFDQAMAQVRAVSGATAEQFRALRDEAERLGRETRYSAREAADGMTFLAMAGMEVDKILGASERVTRLAAAANLDLARSADIVTNIMAGFSMEVEDLDRAVDSLTKAFTSANVDLSMLGESMKYVGPTAQTVGASFEEVTAAVAMLGNVGIQGSMSGTALRRIFSILISPTKAQAREMERLGIVTHDASGEFIGLANVLEQFELVGADAADIMSIFEQRAGTAMAALIGNSARLRAFTEELRNAGGWAEQVAEVQLQGFQGQLVVFKSQLEGAQIAIGRGLTPALSVMTTWIQNGLQAFLDMDPVQRQQIIRWVAVTGAVLAVTSTLGVLARVIVGTVGLLRSFTQVLGFVFSPIVMYSAVAIAAVYALRMAWERDWFGIRTSVENAVEYITEKLDTLVEWWNSTALADALKAWWGEAVKIWQSDELDLPQKILETVNIAPGVDALKEFWGKVVERWESSKLPAFGQKVVATLRLLPGAEWITTFVAGIRTIWEREDITLGQKFVEIARLLPGAKWVEGFISGVRAIWAREDLTFGQKVAEIARLLPGIQWVENFFNDVKAIWAREDLTFGQKVVEIARLFPGVRWVEGFVSSVRAIWEREDLTFGQKVVEIARLLPGAKWVSGFVSSLRVVWAREDLTFGQKVVEIVNLLPGGKWLTGFISGLRVIWLNEDFTFSQKLVEIVRLIPGSAWVEDFMSGVKAIWLREDLTFGQKVAEIGRLLPGGKWVTNFVSDLRTIWDREDLTFGQKFVEVTRLLPGSKWVSDFLADLRAIWHREDLSFGQKFVEVVNLFPGGKWVTGFVSGLRVIWDREDFSLSQKIVEIARLLPGSQWVSGYVSSLRTIWSREDLTFGQKVVEIARLLPGVRWVEGFMDNVRTIWEREDLTFGQKVVEITRLLPGAKWVSNFVAGIKAIWVREDFALGQKVIEIVRLIPGSEWVRGFVSNLRVVWAREDLTFGQKTVEIARLLPGGGWIVNYVERIKGAWDEKSFEFGQKTVEIVRLIPGSRWLAGYIAGVKVIWSREDLTFGQKVAEIARLRPGTAWLADYVERIEAIWQDDELTFGQKAASIAKLTLKTTEGENTWLGDFVEQIRAVWRDSELTLPKKSVETVRLTVGAILDLAESIATAFGSLALNLTRNVAVTLGLDMENSSFGRLLDSIKTWWESEDIELPEKTLGVVAAAATVSWSIRFVTGFVEELAKQSGLGRAVGQAARAGANWLVSLGRIAATGFIAWTLLPGNVREKVAELWNTLGQNIRTINEENFGGNPFVEKVANWLEDLAAEDWRTGALTIGVVIGGFRLVQTAGQLLSMLGSALAAKLAAGATAAAALGKAFAVKISLPAVIITGVGVLTMDKETRQQFLSLLWENMEELKEDLAEIWRDFFSTGWQEAIDRAREEGRIFDPITAFVEAVTESVQAFRNSLDPIRQFLRDWISGMWEGLSLREAFERGMEGESDPKVVGVFKSFLGLGEAIAELLRESISAAFDVADLVGLMFLGSISKVATTLLDVGAEWAGYVVKGFQDAWDAFAEQFETWWGGTWLGQIISELLNRASEWADVGKEWANAIIDAFQEAWDTFTTRFNEWFADTWLGKVLARIEAVEEALRRWGVIGETGDDFDPRSVIYDEARAQEDAIQQAEHIADLSPMLRGLYEEAELIVAILNGAAGELSNLERASYMMSLESLNEKIRHLGGVPVPLVIDVRLHHEEPFEEWLERFQGATVEVEVEPVRLHHEETFEEWLERFQDATVEVEVEMTLTTDDVIEHILNMPGLRDLLDAIYRAEGGAKARVPYGMTGFHDAGNTFGKSVNRERFAMLVGELGLEEGTEDYYRAAAATTVAWYWDTFRKEFPEYADMVFAEIGPEILARFIEHLGNAYAPVLAHELNKNWIPNVKSIMGLPGFREGGWTGNVPVDEIAGVVHGQEIVIPEPAHRKGLPGILEFLGVPGFQSGYLPATFTGGGGTASYGPINEGWIRSMFERAFSVLEDVLGAEFTNSLREAFEGIVSFADRMEREFLSVWDALHEYEEVIEDVIGSTQGLATTIEEMMEAQLRRMEADEDSERYMRLVNAGLEGFARGLDGGNRALAEFVRMLRWNGARLEFSWEGLADLVGSFVASLFSSSPEKLPPALEFDTPDPLGSGGLGEALREKRHLEQHLQNFEKLVENAQRDYDNLFSDPLAAWWHQNFRQDLIHDRQARLNKAQEELDNLVRAIEGFDLKQYLGIDAMSIARAIEAGFDMADPSGLGKSLEDTIKNALIRAWVSSEAMISLQEQFGTMLAELIEQYAETGVIGDLELLRSIIEEIEAQGEAFAEVLEALGLAADKATEKLTNMARNVPSGFRVEQFKFTATSGIPSLASGGYVPSTPGGRIVRLAEGGEGEFVLPESKVGNRLGVREEIHVHFHAPVYGIDEFDRRVEKVARRLRIRRGLVETGNITGGKGF